MYLPTLFSFAWRCILSERWYEFISRILLKLYPKKIMFSTQWHSYFTYINWNDDCVTHAEKLLNTSNFHLPHGRPLNTNVLIDRALCNRTIYLTLVFWSTPRKYLSFVHILWILKRTTPCGEKKWIEHIKCVHGFFFSFQVECH